MFCDQCQETMGGRGCTRSGICGKRPETAAMQDLLVWVTKGLCAVTTQLRREKQEIPESANRMIRENLCVTMTNTNFVTEVLVRRIAETQVQCQTLLPLTEKKDILPEASFWSEGPESYAEKAESVGLVPSGAAAESDPVRAAEAEDIRCFRELIGCAAKGIAAMLIPAADLGEEDADADIFIQRALAQTLDGRMTGGNLLALVMESGRYSVRAMDLLNRAKAKAFGTPEQTEVFCGAKERPGILVTGSNIQDLYLLLEQTADTGVDVYTHGGLFAAHAYPKLKAFPHFAGQYGGSWQTQKEDFERFHGPILATSDGIFLPKSSYRDRLYTTGCAGIPGCPHIAEENGRKDFSALIEQAKTAQAPEQTETAAVRTGFGHAELFRKTDEIAAALRSGEITKLAVVAGDDGRMKKRSYYTDLMKVLPKEVPVLTAGEVLFRFPSMEGSFCGLPRVISAGELADVYSIVQFALRLREVTGVDSLNQLPMFFSLSWYGQRSVAVLLALLYLDIRHITLGPTWPAFFSGNVRRVFADYFGLKETGSPQADADSVLGISDVLIREDMIVGDVVDQYPSLIPVMAEMGLHCIGCGVSKMETMAQACLTHGLNVYDLLEVLNSELQRKPEGDI